MTTVDTRTHYWERITDGCGHWKSDKTGPPGAELAALRRGIDREPGDVPAMWSFYTTLNAQGAVRPSLRAEHLALTLFAVHQQSQSRPMHQDGIGFGTAMRALRDSDKFSVEAVDRRFAAAATAGTLVELGVHLRGLISQLRSLTSPSPLDYTRLFRDLWDWQNPERQPAVRRRWGSQYFVRTATRSPSAQNPDGSATTTAS